MSGNSNPSVGQSPADAGTLGGALRKILQKAMQATDVMLPAVVVSATPDRKYATVRPQIMVVGTDQSKTKRAQIAKVPVFHIGAGGYILTFPIKPGDLGWIVASDRDISLFLKSGKDAEPNTARLHSFEDGVFIPDAARNFTLAAGEDNSAVLQALDGSAYVAISAGQIKIKHPTKLEVDTPLAHFTHDITAEGTIRGKTDVLSGSGEISGKTHHHGGVTTGGGNSGGPAN